MTRRVADVIVETLSAAGAKRCYGVPGDTLNYVTDAIRRSDIRWVHVRHEEAGAFAAGADALLTGELAMCRIVRTGQPSFHQRCLGIQSKPCPGCADRQPNCAGRTWI
ncbi:thiamine pyrophosphate-binding protein [Agrobacterium cavarae]|uniref:thiamine pyrophosphate-binding protein n=1 Tax=Agrobacterium cavarae TaxID=2528239 RepID=UPI003FCEF99B